MPITKIMSEPDVISELYLTAAEMQLNRFCKQMPYHRCIDIDNRYTTCIYSGIGYTFGGTVVGIPDLTEYEQTLYAIYQNHHGRISSIIRDDAYMSLVSKITAISLYETSEILRLDDGALVGIRANVGLYNLAISPNILDNLQLNWRSYWNNVLKNTNVRVYTTRPDWAISSVLWFEEEQE